MDKKYIYDGRIKKNFMKNFHYGNKEDMIYFYEEKQRMCNKGSYQEEWDIA